MGIQDVEPGAGGVVDQPPGADGKRYIKISVPDFNGDGRLLGSYLRLGATEAGVTPATQNSLNAAGIDPTGEDLAAYATGFADDMRDRGDASAQPLSPPETLPPGTTAAAGTRVAESVVLHKKGGWRDHSDGNRVTTTRGDKVEVIRGNYRMVVLGRQDDQESAAGWDVSGGLMDAADLGKKKKTDAAHDANNLYNVEYKWEKDSDGRWGWTQVTVTGAWDTSAAPGKDPSGNGKQISFTWVDETQTYIGSPQPTVDATTGLLQDVDESKQAKPVNLIKGRTWANTVDLGTHAYGNMTNALRSDAVMLTDTSSGGLMTTNLHSDAQMTNNTSAGGHMANKMSCSADIYNEMTAQDAITSVTGTGVALTQVAMAPLSSSLNLSAAIINVSISALLLELKSWMHLDIHLGPHLDMHLIQHFEFHAGAHLLHKTAGCFEMTESTNLSVCAGISQAISTAFCLG